MFNNCKNNMRVTQRFTFYAKLSPAVRYSVIFRIHKTLMYYLLKYHFLQHQCLSIPKLKTSPPNINHAKNLSLP